MNAKIAEYRTIFFALAAFAIWLGWTQESPGARVTRVENRVESVADELADSVSSVKKEVALVRSGQVRTHDALEVLVRLRCFDSTLSARDMKLAGLDCSDIERARRTGASGYDTTSAVIRSR